MNKQYDVNELNYNHPLIKSQLLNYIYNTIVVANYRYKIIMIEVGGFIHQFYVSKTQEKSNNCDSVFVTDSHK